MQEQIHIHPDPLPLRPKEIQKLRIIELRLQQIIQRHQSARPRDRYRAIAPLEAKHTHLIRRNREVEFLPVPLGVPSPRDEDAPVGEVLSRVLEGAEFRDAAGAGEFALVVPLLGEGHEEALLALFVLQRDHRLLDVVVVGLELAFEVGGLVVEAGEGELDGFELAGAGDAAAVLGADVDGDGVEEVLVVVVAREAAVLRLEAEDVFEGGAFEVGVGERGEVDERVFRVGGAGMGAREFIADEGFPAVFVFGRDGFDHDFEEISARLHADDVEDAAFGFGEEGYGLSVGVFSFVEFGVQSEANLGGADVHELIFVAFGTAELADHFSKHVIVAWGADIGCIACHELMYREDVRHLDVQCWLRSGIQIIEFVDVKMLLSVRDLNH